MTKRLTKPGEYWVAIWTGIGMLAGLAVGLSTNQFWASVLSGMAVGFIAGLVVAKTRS